MKIQIIGSGCPICKNLYELTKTAVAELGVEAEVEYVPDINKIIELGVMESPIITINGKIAMLGSGNLEKIKTVINNGKDSETPQKSACTCGGNC
jgi:small redox-active disulfide protein 2